MQPIAALLEWIERGRQFRHEEDYAALLGNEFAIDQTGNSQKHFTTWWFFSVTKSDSMRPAEFGLTAARFVLTKISFI